MTLADKITKLTALLPKLQAAGLMSLTQPITVDEGEPDVVETGGRIDYLSPTTFDFSLDDLEFNGIGYLDIRKTRLVADTLHILFSQVSG